MPLPAQAQAIFDRIFSGTAPWMPGAQDPRVVGQRLPLPTYQVPGPGSPVRQNFAPMLQGLPSPIATPPIPTDMPGEPQVPYALGGPSPTAPMPPIGAGGDAQIPQGMNVPLPTQKPPVPRRPGPTLDAMPSLSSLDAMPSKTPGNGFMPGLNPEMGGGRAPSPSGAPSPSDALAQPEVDKLTAMFGPDMGRNLMYFGAATMAAGGKPGATLGGSVGQGALAALQASDQKRIQDRADKKEDREAKMAERKLNIEDKRAETIDRYYKGLIDEKGATRELQDKLKTTENDIRRMQAEGRINEATARSEIAATRLAYQQSLADINGRIKQEGTDNKALNDIRKDARDRSRADATTVDPITGAKTYDSKKSSELYDQYLYEGHMDAGIEPPDSLRKRMEGRAGAVETLPTAKDGKPDPTKLTVGKTYQTQRGPAKWNGTAFEPVAP